MLKKPSDRRIQIYLTDDEIRQAEKKKGDHKTRHRWGTAVIRKALAK